MRREVGKGGSLIIFTGKKTGRSPKDKHIVREETLQIRSGGKITG